MKRENVLSWLVIGWMAVAASLCVFLTPPGVLAQEGASFKVLSPRYIDQNVLDRHPAQVREWILSQGQTVVDSFETTFAPAVRPAEAPLNAEQSLLEVEQGYLAGLIEAGVTGQRIIDLKQRIATLRARIDLLKTQEDK